MSCDRVQERIPFLVDGSVPGDEREILLAHAASCRPCGARLETHEHQRAMLRAIQPAPVPAALAAKLRVLASHELQRQLNRVSVATRIQNWLGRLQLAFDNMMRPVALPFTGGLLLTLLVFGSIVPTLSFSHDLSGQEFFTDPSGTLVTNPWDQGADWDSKDVPRIESLSAPISDYVNVVDLNIDETGRVSDWTIVRGQLTDDMKSIILLGRFQPATAFGVRTSGTIRVVQSAPPCIRLRCSATVRG